MIKEGQYHYCEKCELNTYTKRIYIRGRKVPWDHDHLGKANPRKWKAIGWYCMNCNHLEREGSMINSLLDEEYDSHLRSCKIWHNSIEARLSHTEQICEDCNQEIFKPKFIEEKPQTVNRSIAPKGGLSLREIEFLNDLLKLKHNNSDWYGHHRMDYHFNGGDNGNGWIVNKMRNELLDTGKYSYNYVCYSKSKLLHKRGKITCPEHAEILESAIDRLRRL